MAAGYSSCGSKVKACGLGCNYRQAFRTYSTELNCRSNADFGRYVSIVSLRIDLDWVSIIQSDQEVTGSRLWARRDENLIVSAQVSFSVGKLVQAFTQRLLLLNICQSAFTISATLGLYMRERLIRTKSFNLNPPSSSLSSCLSLYLRVRFHCRCQHHYQYGSVL